MWIWRLFLLLMALTAVRYVLARIFPTKRAPQPRNPDRRAGRQAVSKRMVKDPQCGMYVAPELAVEARTAAGSLFFCSKECRDSYVRQIERRGP
jgi:YHS domain-containing protein